MTSLNSSLAGNFGFGVACPERSRRNDLSRRTSLTRPNGVVTNYSYDNLSRLLSVLHQAGGTTTIDGATYTYDNAGNRLTKSNSLDSSSESYAYDAIYQLQQVTHNSTVSESYSHDPVGNRLSSLGASPYSYNSSNELTSTPTDSFTYDHNGNTLTNTDSSGTTQYAWDFENQLTSVTLPNGAGVVSFTYDPFGRRIEKSGPSGTVIYAYDGSNGIEELNASGAATARYVEGSGIDEPLAQSGTALSFYEADGLGSITSMTDSSGTASQIYMYDAYGNLTGSAGNVTNVYRYTGREFDQDTGLYYYRARYYDPVTGRFLSEDPVMFAGSNNFYGYVANAPIDLVDPFGLQALPKPVPESVPAIPPGPVPVPSKPPVSTIETLTGWLGDVLLRAGAVGTIVLGNPLPLNQDELDWLRQRDHDRYKDVCNGQVPAGPNPCSTLSREIDRLKRCISLMIAFDARWTPSRHNDAISQWENGLDRLKDQYTKECTPQKECKKKTK